VTTIAAATCALPSVVHAGLGYNALDVPQMPALARAFSSAVVVDVSFNALSDLGRLLLSLSCMERLRHVVLAGNPCAAVLGYRRAVRRELPQLLSLDDISTAEDVEAAADEQPLLTPGEDV
jgi:hypothetical protein